DGALWTRPIPQDHDVRAASRDRTGPRQRGEEEQGAGESHAQPRLGSPTLADLVAAKLTQGDSLRFEAWRPVFEPVARTLTERLRVIYSGPQVEARDRAYTLLFGFANRMDNPNRAEDLAALLVEAEPTRMRLILDLLGGPHDRPRAIATL